MRARTAAFALAFALAGCTKSDDDTVDTDVTDSDVDSDVTADCSLETDAPSCLGCCGDSHADAYAVYLTYQAASCACAVDAPCDEACTVPGNNVCSDEAPTAACTTCLAENLGGDCAGAAAQPCAEDATCAPFASCVMDICM